MATDDETRALIEKGLIPASATPRNTVPEKPTPPSQNRITVVETVSFTSVEGERFLPVETKYWVPLSNNDRPYQRAVTVTEELTPLDLGWAREWPKIGLVHVRNVEGLRRQFQPTPAELEETARRVVELGDWLIPPETAIRGYHKDPTQLLIRCQHATARVIVTIYPA